MVKYVNEQKKDLRKGQEEMTDIFLGFNYIYYNTEMPYQPAFIYFISK